MYIVEEETGRRIFIPSVVLDVDVVVVVLVKHTERDNHVGGSYCPTIRTGVRPGSSVRPHSSEWI